MGTSANHPLLRARGVAALLVALVLLAGACGSSDSSSDDGGGETENQGREVVDEGVAFQIPPELR